jgi:hypothetical protein
VNKIIKDQRGTAMVLELLLVAVVILAVGLALVAQSNNAKTTGPAPQAKNTAKLSTAPTGSVDNAVDAITQETAGDQTVAQEEGAMTPQTDLSTGSAQNVETSYNENNF